MKVELTAKKPFLEKIRYYKKQILIATPIIAMFVFAVYSQTAFKEPQDTKSKAAGRILNVKDYGGVQQAINVSVSGDSIYIPAGTYTGPFKVSGKNNITIYGDGAASIINAPGQQEVLGIYSSSNINLRDFAVAGDYSVTSQRGIGVFGLITGNFQRLTIYDVGFSGIFSNGQFEDVVMSDLNVRHCGDFGVQFKAGAKRISVVGGTFSEFASRLYPGHAVYSEGGQDVTVRGIYANKVVNAPNMYEVSGIKITETTNALVENNTIEDSHACVSVPASQNVIVKNNICRRLNARGMYILSGSNAVTFENNYIETAPIGYEFSHYTTWPQNITLINNVCKGCVTPVLAGSTTNLNQTNNSWQPGYISPVPSSAPPTMPPQATIIPTNIPQNTIIPTKLPTVIPTKIPTSIPTKVPTTFPTFAPTIPPQASTYGITIMAIDTRRGSYKMLNCGVYLSTTHAFNSTPYTISSARPISMIISVPSNCSHRRFSSWSTGQYTTSIAVSDITGNNGEQVYTAYYR